ncbi:MAG: hypothetical protein WD768_06210 [Phycisphaeraceae bacterium]
MKQEPQVILCPYCGHVQVVPDNASVPDQCAECRGLFEPLSRRATQISMGPWYIRDKKNPFRPGASFEVISKMARNGRIKPTTVLRGPSTKQFWSVARNVPGISHLLGYCHKCNAKVKADDKVCHACGEKFDEPKERNELGLAYRTAAEAAAAQKALEKEIAQLTGQPTAGSSGPAKPSAPGEGLLDEVLGVKGGSSLLNFAGGPSNGEGDAKPKGAPKKAPPLPPAAPAASGFAAGFTSGAAAPEAAPRVVDAFSLGGEMDDTGEDPTERKQRTANTMTWLLVGFNALVIVVLIALLVLNKGKPAESQTPTTPGNNNTGSTGNSANTNGAGTRVATNTPTTPPKNTNTTTNTPTNTPVTPLPVTPELTVEEATKQYNEMLKMWEQAQDAYKRDELEGALTLLTKIRDEYPRKSHPDDLYENIANVTSEIVRRRSASEDLAKVDEMSALLTSASTMVKANKLQSAIDILSQVRDTFPARLHPTNLEVEIGKLKKEMERQKNAKFFGQPTG